jgi:opacity protein-like surface antigen
MKTPWRSERNQTLQRRIIMKKALAICLSILFVCSFALSAYAAEKDQGLYLSIGAGYSLLGTQNDQYGGSWEFNNGPVAKGALGYLFNASPGINLRTEFELSYRKYAGDSHKSVNGTVKDLSGNISYLSGMVNGLCDFKTGTGFTPYIGVGLGMSQVTWSDVKIAGYSYGLDDSDNVFAYQAMGGVGYGLTDSLILDLECRYFHAQDVTLKNNQGTEFAMDNNTNHSFLIGLRYLF